MQFPGGRIGRESPATKALRSLTPLLRCHQPIDTADQQLLLGSVDEPVRCHGLPSSSVWFGGGDGSAAVAFVAIASVLATALVLNALVLWLLHIGRIRLTDFGVIGICANALSDLALALNYLVNDHLVPLLPSSAQQADSAGSSPLSILEALSPALLCRFRMYIGQSCLSMNILVLASLALFAGRKAYERFVGSAPCGIFMFPSLLAFLALGANIWFLVLCECRMLAFGYNTRLAVSLPVLLTDQSAVGWALFGLSAGSQLLPLGLAGYFLWRNWRPTQGDERTRRLIHLTASLCAAHALCLPQTVLLTAYFAQPPASQRGSLTLMILGFGSAACTAVMLAAKPALYLMLHPDIRLACQRRVLRRGGVAGGSERSCGGGSLRLQNSIMSSVAPDGMADNDGAEEEAVAAAAEAAGATVTSATEQHALVEESGESHRLLGSAAPSPLTLHRRGQESEEEESMPA